MIEPSQRLLDLIASFEAFRGVAYICPGGAWTIGYGTTRYPDGKAVAKGDTCTRDDGWKWLSADVGNVREEVIKLIQWEAPEHVVDACTSLAYNIGLAAFRDSTCLKRLNGGDKDGAAAALRWWNKATSPKDGKKRVLGGLLARREVEADLLVNGWDGTAGTTAAPIEEIQPKLVKSGRVWFATGAVGSGLAVLLPEIVTTATEHATSLGGMSRDQLIVSAGGMVLGWLGFLWRQRMEMRNGELGSQGR
jgi:lysozyme